MSASKMCIKTKSQSFSVSHYTPLEYYCNITIAIVHVDSETYFMLFLELIVQLVSNLCPVKQHQDTKKVCSQVHVFKYIDKSICKSLFLTFPQSKQDTMLVMCSKLFARTGTHCLI